VVWKAGRGTYVIPVNCIHSGGGEVRFVFSCGINQWGGRRKPPHRTYFHVHQHEGVSKVESEEISITVTSVSVKFEEASSEGGANHDGGAGPPVLVPAGWFAKE